MSGALFLVLLTLGVGIFSNLLAFSRRAQGLLWLGTAFFVLWALAGWPGQRPVLVLGRPVVLGAPWTVRGLTFQVDALARSGLAFAWLWVALWAGIAVLLPRWARGLGWLWPALVGIVLATSVSPRWAWGWAWAVWAALSLVAVYGGTLGRARAAWQWLTPFVAGALVLTSLLLWPDPNRETVEPWRLEVVTFTFILLSGLVPLHVGGVHLGESGHPLGNGWIWWGQSLLALVLFGRIGQDATWRPALEAAWPFLHFLAGTTFLWTGLAALASDNLGRQTGYAAAYNWALTLTLWEIDPTESARIAWTLAVRGMGLGLATLALSALLEQDARRDTPSLSGWARRRPWAAAAWVVGTATLVGIPFTAGGWSLWWVRQGTRAADPLAWLALAGSAAFMLGLIRSILRLWGGLEQPLLPREQGLGKMVMVIATLGGILLGVVPKWAVVLSAWVR